MISDKAVEAATAVFPWQAADYLDTDTVRAALEAAAPYMPSDLEVFARMFEGFVENLREDNVDNDPFLVGEINAYTCAARQLRVAINDRSEP